MRDGLYLNGVYEAVLKDIVKVHALLPDQRLFLQPYKMAAVSILRNDPPTAKNPVYLYISTENDLAHVAYRGEICEWWDKRTIPAARRAVYDKLVMALQSTEKCLYPKGVNAIVVRNMVKLARPFHVSQLIVRSTMKPMCTRTVPGGWAIVLPEPISQTGKVA